MLVLDGIPRPLAGLVILWPNSRDFECKEPLDFAQALNSLNWAVDRSWADRVPIYILLHDDRARSELPGIPRVGKPYDL